MNAPQTDEELLQELAGAYRTAKQGGKWVRRLFIGLLASIILISQAWDVIKVKLGFH